MDYDIALLSYVALAYQLILWKCNHSKNLTYIDFRIDVILSDCVLPINHYLNFKQMPDAVVDYNLSDGKWNIIQQQSILHERTRILYGTTSSAGASGKISNVLENSVGEANFDDDQMWNTLSEFYACERFNVSSYDGVLVPLTVVYSYKCKKENENPGLLHVHGAYGELLDKRWRSELKSLLDRGWVIAFADVRFVSVFISLNSKCLHGLNFLLIWSG